RWDLGDEEIVELISLLEKLPLFSYIPSSLKYGFHDMAKRETQHFLSKILLHGSKWGRFKRWELNSCLWGVNPRPKPFAQT
ncbi:hypothetical protein ABK046_50980, partial [Streptomyces caeruleatus]